MTRIRKWTLGTAAVSLFILLVSWFFLVSPKKSEAADVKSQTEAQISSNQQLRTRLDILVAQSAKLPDQQARLAAIRQHLPETAAEAQLIRSLSAAAAATNVNLKSVKPAPAAPVTSAAGASGQLTNSGLMVMNVDTEVFGSYFDLERYLNKLEGMQRSFLVTGFTLVVPDESKGSASGITLTIAGKVYFSPNLTTAPAAPISSAAPSTASN